MGDAFSNLTGPQLIAFVSVVGSLICVGVVIVTGIMVPFMTSARRVEAITQLKRDLVAAGYSADDIERIVKASPEEGSSSRRCGARAETPSEGSRRAVVK